MTSSPTPRSAAGLTAVGIFLSFGSLIALLAGISLVWTGTVLDQIWRLNPSAYQHLAPLGKLVGIPFLILSALLGIAAVCWFQRRLWGWRLAVAIIATQVLGDAVNLALGHFLQGATGVLIAGALLLYLLRPQIRTAFPSPHRP